MLCGTVVSVVGLALMFTVTVAMFVRCVVFVCWDLFRFSCLACFGFLVGKCCEFWWECGDLFCWICGDFCPGCGNSCLLLVCGVSVVIFVVCGVAVCSGCCDV